MPSQLQRKAKSYNIIDVISYQSIEFVNILLKDISQIDLVPYMTHFSSYVITYMFSFIKYVNLHIYDYKNRSNKTQFILNAEGEAESSGANYCANK